MTARRILIITVCTNLIGACANAPDKIDAQTAAWWRTTKILSNDDMEGRDTGSPGYDRAAAYVADRFKEAGLAPAGDGATYFQPIRFDEIEVVTENTSIAVTSESGAARPLRFLHEISVTPTWSLPTRISAPLVFRGYCAPSDMAGVSGAVVACFGTRRTGQPHAGAQMEAAAAAGAVGLMRVDDMGFTIEPPRWPLAYARTVVIEDGAPRARSIASLRLSASAFIDLAERSGRNGADILAQGARGEPMGSFDFQAQFEATFATRERKLASSNVIGLLPGSDPDYADQPVLLIAHLDGYGYGTAVKGDNLYYGMLDDAAYVATLITFAEARRGKGFRRPVIFAAVTGEEKGLLGSRWLAAHPTPAAPTPIAVLNLDQLRPLYPFTILTTLGLNDSTLGRTVRDVATAIGVEVRPDLEPERGLLRRTDHWPFMQRGVPAVSFLFGFDPSDSSAQARYREWYENRYHAPQDDKTTPIDFGAQAKFHQFYFALTQAVADGDADPEWLPDSPNRPAEAP